MSNEDRYVVRLDNGGWFTDQGHPTDSLRAAGKFLRLTGYDGARVFREERSAHTYVPSLRRVTVRRKVKP